MKAAFIVTLDVGSDTDFLALAEDIAEACTQHGLAVIQAKPYPRAGVPAAAPLINPISVPNAPPPLA